MGNLISFNKLRFNDNDIWLIMHQLWGAELASIRRLLDGQRLFVFWKMSLNT